MSDRHRRKIVYYVSFVYVILCDRVRESHIWQIIIVERGAGGCEKKIMKNRAIGRHSKREMWISNNKVLIGGGMKKPHARNPNFETEETKLLISLWGDPKVQKTLITTHKKHPVIAKLAESMREHGYHRSPEEINTRIKNLKCFYNRIKKDLEMGVTTEPTWRHYTAM